MLWPAPQMVHTNVSVHYPNQKVTKWMTKEYSKIPLIRPLSIENFGYPDAASVPFQILHCSMAQNSHYSDRFGSRSVNWDSRSPPSSDGETAAHSAVTTVQLIRTRSRIKSAPKKLRDQNSM